MLPTRLLLPVAVLLLVAPLAGAHGTFAGTIRQGEIETFVVDHAEPICPQVVTTHTVTLTHEPTTDELLLVVTGQGVARTQDGFAQVSFTTSTPCVVFVVHVVGARVADEAAFTVEVAHGFAGGGGGGSPA